MQIYADVTGRPFQLSALGPDARRSARRCSARSRPGLRPAATPRSRTRPGRWPASATMRLRADPRQRGDLRRPLPRVRPAARLLRAGRERRDEDAQGGSARREGAPADRAPVERLTMRLEALRERARRGSTPSSRATTSWSGPAATSAPAIRRPASWRSSRPASATRTSPPSRWSSSTSTAAVVEGDLKPSSDTASHLYIYRHRPDVNGVVHTHSRYATAFAAVGRPIPVYLTAQADEFGGEIPCAGLRADRRRGDRRLVVEGIGRSPAILLKNHGVFTVGPTAEAAVKAAVMVEDVAATVWAALQLGDPERLADGRRRPAPSPLHDRLRPVTAPPSDRSHPCSTSATPRSGSSPAASTCTARRRSSTSPSTPPQIAAALDDVPGDPGPGRRQAGPDGLRRDPRADERGEREPDVRRAHRLDAHVLARPRCGSPACELLREAAAPPAHPVQPRDPLGRDRHGLHEPEPGRPRRPRVRVHRGPAAARAQGRRRPLGRRGGPGPHRRVGAGRLRPARLGDRQDRALRRQHARGRGHRGRQGRGPATPRLQHQRLRRRRPRRARSTRPRDAEVDELVATYLDEYDVVPELRPGGDRADALRDGARIELGPAAVPRRRRLHRLHDHVRGPARPDPAARARRPAADARRLRLRRRGRLEDRVDGPGDEGHGRGARRAACRSWRTTRTTCRTPATSVLGAHMLEVCESIAGGPAAARDPSALDRRQGRSGPARLRCPPGRGRRRLRHRHGPAVPDASRRSSTSSPRCSRCPNLPVARALWRPRPDLTTNAAAWIHAGGSHHTSLGYAVTPEHLADFAAMSGVEFVLIDETTRLPEFRDRLRWNDLYHLLARGV